MIVAIDGPSGTGKSSVSRRVAYELGLMYVDTGAVYRALAYEAYRNNIADNNEYEIAELGKKIHIEMYFNNGYFKIAVDGEEITHQIRSELISSLASKISQHPKVRESLLHLQRELGLRDSKGAVVEGRDIGTIVFPDAPLKIFLVADDDKRAQRRFDELQSKGQHDLLDDIKKAMKERDERDKNRAVAPTVPASDAVVVDTTNMSEQEVVDELKRLIIERKK